VGAAIALADRKILLDKAERELLKALELSPGGRETLYHLGRFYEAKNDGARAEEYYVKGLAVQSPGTNPSEAALKAISRA